MKESSLPLDKWLGSNVFSDKVMRKRLPPAIYKKFKQTVEKGTPLSHETAKVIAGAMKDWALEKGATHFTHWFQPLTEMTAEKHESFVSIKNDGNIALEFTADMLIQGEPDASSFPSGGLRATFEARGYTIWDCTSPAFLKEDASGDLTLCIPTAFCSYTGESLDKKTPLLRSMEAISKQTVRLLRALGNKTVNKVHTTVGPEQEYFLIDKEFYDQRMDLKFCGRTLFGAQSPKGQELEDQYFGSIKDRVAHFMKQIDIDLWKMGISANTKHNEVAPGQFELAVVFTTSNLAADHNQLVMESLKKMALRHGLVCLLHEKPFEGINGSGKHNNWSLSTDQGENLLEPGSTPHDNLQFMLVVAGIIKAIDTHAELLRSSIANSGNDLRLGIHEAPPAIVSIFLGERLNEIFSNIAKKQKSKSRNRNFVQLGVDTLPQLPKHDTDRNRTSPFAFTGNKFELRMVGSSASIARPNFTLNTIVAEAFDEIATRLERASKKEMNQVAETIIREIIQKHGRVIFNGNGYSDEWIKEAAKRGIPNIPSTVQSMNAMLSPQSVALFEKYKVLSRSEVHSRYESFLDTYTKEIAIEAKTAIRMVKTLYLPAVISYAGQLAEDMKAFISINTQSNAAEEVFGRVRLHLDAAYEALKKLEAHFEKSRLIGDLPKKAAAFRDKIRPALVDLRVHIDALETLLPNDQWPVPTYAEMLFNL